ncbi:hypothetical protein LEP1GSC150_2198 [Leptospira interrogans serovar Copenhageni str. LT2050]|uniref:Uncharacterized protein n=2 Tax=Leptospira interrogans TaxID=173 RepID=M6HR69_LEPIR|nr:hypothetical protein LEP1GSC150_2198 [Leptospira interrogans serovar Copenhageni str. LT2050]EMM97897.1 hypothetical protein LEP1GSC158_2825 [Leptospira interrogans serovar Zanoni str. LT2156]
MLRHTFCHLPGIDSKEEKNLWEKGIYDWKDLEIYLKTEPAPIRNLILDALEFSKKELERENFFTSFTYFPQNTTGDFFQQFGKNFSTWI